MNIDWAQWTKPVNLTLAIMLVLAVYVAVRAQRRNDFDWANSLKDEQGKESIARLGALVALAISTWVIMHVTVEGKLTEWLYTAYLLTWSGSMVLAKAVDNWKSKP